ncbi:MAG: nucleotidyltransferase domain-containing protein [Candidatus Beckwithbacteria bacterium]|nr:nucleotidyltransferase domain-containing protein [Patescibacteria group bacterium]
MQQKQAIQLAKKYISLVKKKGVPVTKAYLFGSYAKNTAKNYSDLDISIISPVFGKNWINEGVRLSMIAGKLDERIEPHPMTSKDMANKYNPLAYEIKTHGILLTK